MSVSLKTIAARLRTHQQRLVPLAIGSSLLLAFGLGRCSGDTPTLKAESSAEEDRSSQTVAFSEEQLRRSGLIAIRPESISATERPISGFVESAVGSRASVGMPVSGRITRLLVAPGSNVRAGEVIAEISSPEAAVARAEAEAARASAQSLDHQYRRVVPMAQQGALAWQEMESRRIASVKAASEAKAAYAKAISLGSPDAMGRLLIRSPITGHIAAMKATPGSVLQTGGEVAEISNAQGSELRFMVSPLLGANLQAGQVLRVKAGPRELSARVLAVAPDGALGNRVMVVRAQAEQGALPPAGTALTAFVMVPSAERRFTVPADALQVVNGSAVVFRYQRGLVESVPVVLGPQSAGRVVILQGVRSGETLLAGNTQIILSALSSRRP
jgi:cobalt-zinc-cadmium efflux system membrane fusion protein